MRDIISVQSSVAFGYVGNRVAVFALETLGYPVIQINTVQFSAHTGHKGFAGQSFDRKHIQELFASLFAMDCVQNSGSLLSGYIGNRETGEVIVNNVLELKKCIPGFVYCCDPVMGDSPHGLYVRPEIADFFSSRALAVSDILIPNHFEACYLSKIQITTIDDAKRACDVLHHKGPRIILITSYHKTDDGKIGFFLSDTENQAVLETPRLFFSNTPKGTGDLVSSLFLAHFLSTANAVSSLEAAANTVFSILKLTQNTNSTELALIEGREYLCNPELVYKAEIL